MSLHYPRRVKDLPSLDADEEDDLNTPQKMENNQAYESHNKENFNSESSQRMYPKRSSELPKFDSDSELDESLKNDNLNCAILNDSFILSPCRNELNEEISMETPAGKLLKKIEATEGDANENLSFVAQFNKMDLNVNTSETPEPSGKQQIPISINRSLKQSLSCRTLESIDENKSQETSLSNVPNGSTSIRRKAADTPYRTTKSVRTTNGATNGTSTKTTSNVNEGQFATPQIRSFSMQKRPRDLCSTQSQKSRSAVVNEFRSQKVLFQTPIALSRVPLACLPNDSVTLSLCDTINESGNTPSTVEKSPQKEERKSVGKSKKALEGEFAATDQCPEKENVVSRSEECKAPSATPVVTDSTKANTTKQANIKINGKEYTVIQKLGCGGSSSVYLAQRKDDDKECALKVVDLRGDPAVIEGYMNETKLLAKLQGNVCVVSLYDYQLLQKESKLFMVMEKGDSDLQKILQGYTTNLPLYVLVNYLYQMLQAVNYIHQNGVIHSDLKPANFLMVQGRLKLIDFGIASNIAIDSTSIIKFSQAGTFNYISPEALTDTSTGTSPMRKPNQPKIKISTKSDVWSLGCILYLFLYKKTPFSHIKNIYAKITTISNPKTTIEYPGIPAYYPIMLVHMVKNCLQHNPKQRPSCAELLQYPFHMIIPIPNMATSTQESATGKNT